ncbi:uncharacterized protein LOC124455284 [Xenia sp. Carnegie-2017]|uniref:uncharacterized protein LOC124455284 n=1 Tax=Xenia sp. Carnegie-2017 TaxID=2897299 RepID=UPI001F04E857|nr:uncharacterized protein LOC124455284 [Xenia sp. Carnegie-2017]
MVRRKQLKLNVAVLIAKYNNMYEELRHLSRRRIPVTSIHGNISIVSTQITETIQPATRHDFVARILDLKPGLTSDGSEEVVAINVVMFDGEILLNGSIVKDVISCLDEAVNNILGCTYYSGVLYSESVPGSVYSPLVIGASGGSLGLVVLMITLWFCRKRQRRLKKIKSEKTANRSGDGDRVANAGHRHNGYRSV